jgi:ABC-type multidrug transport system fused ATPase/permease subunit
MKKFFGVLKYVRGYWRYAWLNVFFNILSVVFNLFSLLSVIPLLTLLFTNKPEEFTARVAKGEPVIGRSVNDLLEWVNYKFSVFIVESGDPSSARMRVLLWICVGIIGVFFFKSLTRYLAMFFLANVRNGVVRDFRNRMYDKCLRLPLSWYSNERKGDIMSRITSDLHEVEWSVMSSLEMTFREPITIISIVIIMISMSWQMTLAVVITTPVIGLLLSIVSKSLKKSSGKAKEKHGTILSMLEEMLGGLRIIKGFNAEEKIGGKFKDENQEYTRIMIRNYRKTDLASPLSEFLIVIVIAGVLYYGGNLVIREQQMDGKFFVGYLLIFFQLIAPVRQFTQAYYNVQKGLASMERINVILDAEETIRDAARPKPLEGFSKEIEYLNVSFAYSRGDDGYAVKNVNLKVQKGKTVALVGQSGSGKTTLADLLPRFYDVTEGVVLVDGNDIRDVKMKDLRALMGVVSQESILFNDTVYNNIAFGVENTTQQQVEDAARIANAHEFISEMPEGYQTNIGDRGSKMSGGQRQRIAIARAILKNPPILILDEATSALDTSSERLVQDALNNLMRNRTSIIIAHRLSTIQHADEIIVLKKGEIIERGTHNDLLAKNGAYKQLYDMQAFV